MSINPMAPGHVLVVPIEEIDHWIDASAELAAHLFEVDHDGSASPSRRHSAVSASA